MGVGVFRCGLEGEIIELGQDFMRGRIHPQHAPALPAEAPLPV